MCLLWIYLERLSIFRLNSHPGSCLMISWYTLYGSIDRYIADSLIRTCQLRKTIS
jgi:hypothetical protein